MVKGRYLHRLLKQSCGDSENYSVFDSSLVLTPLRHIRAQIWFAATPYKDLFDVAWIVKPMFAIDFGYPGFAPIPVSPKGGSYWHTGLPDLERVVRETIDTKVVPILKEGMDITGYETFLARHMLGGVPDHQYAALLSLALGDLDRAAFYIKHGRVHWGVESLNAFSPGLGDRLHQRGSRVSKRDRAALAAALHSWERSFAEKAGFLSIWQPSPFPIEQIGTPDDPLKWRR